MIEEPLQFGEGGRLFGVLTRPDEGSSDAPVVVFLNAGLLHRAGPHRLHVRIARRLAAHGLSSLRVDLGGIGDSLTPPGIAYPESVAIDFADVLDLLSSEADAEQVYLFGLCSGADNAIRLAADHPRVAGMVLIDPVCEKDEEFASRAGAFSARALATKAATPSRYVTALKRRIDALTRRSDERNSDDAAGADSLALRGIPDPELTRRAFEKIRVRQGRVLCIFTADARRYYNVLGQMGRVLAIEDYDSFATEIFWPHSRHTFPLETHRLRLMDAIEAWVTKG